MSNPALRRTVRRGVALLLVPSSAMVVGTERYVWSDHYGLYPPDPLGRLAFEFLPVALLLGSLAYLATSLSLSALRRLDADEAPKSEPRSDEIGSDG